MPSGPPIAIVTGANRGLGRETCRQLSALGYEVVLTGRDEARAHEAAMELQLDHMVVDVENEASIQAFASAFGGCYEQLDLLVNNAGVALDGFDAEVARRTIQINTWGALHLADALSDLLRQSKGTVVMVSSGMGELSCLSPALQRRFSDEALSRTQLESLLAGFIDAVRDGTHREQGWPSSAYRVSKVGLNAVARILAREMPDVRINAVCPGWVQTDMGGAAVTRDVEDGAGSIVWAATLPPDGPTGGFFRDGQRIAW